MVQRPMINRCINAGGGSFRCYRFVHNVHDALDSWHAKRIELPDHDLRSTRAITVLLAGFEKHLRSSSQMGLAEFAMIRSSQR